MLRLVLKVVVAMVGSSVEASCWQKTSSEHLVDLVAQSITSG